MAGINFSFPIAKVAIANGTTRCLAQVFPGANHHRAFVVRADFFGVGNTPAEFPFEIWARRVRYDNRGTGGSIAAITPIKQDSSQPETIQAVCDGNFNADGSHDPTVFVDAGELFPAVCHELGRWSIVDPMPMPSGAADANRFGYAIFAKNIGAAPKNIKGELRCNE